MLVSIKGGAHTNKSIREASMQHIKALPLTEVPRKSPAISRSSEIECFEHHVRIMFCHMSKQMNGTEWVQSPESSFYRYPKTNDYGEYSQD